MGIAKGKNNKAEKLFWCFVVADKGIANEALL
jgi:hypothetical protein